MIRNPLATQTIKEKQEMYARDRETAVAYADGNKVVPLKTVAVENVEFIAGFWRVQNLCNFEIKRVRDRDLIIGNRLPRNENTYFEFYQAMRPVFNCYGLISKSYDVIVAKYDNEYAYGDTIADARAFLGVRMYEKYKDVIDAHRRNRQK